MCLSVVQRFARGVCGRFARPSGPGPTGNGCDMLALMEEEISEDTSAATPMIPLVAYWKRQGLRHHRATGPGTTSTTTSSSSTSCDGGLEPIASSTLARRRSDKIRPPIRYQHTVASVCASDRNRRRLSLLGTGGAVIVPEDAQRRETRKHAGRGQVTDRRAAPSMHGQE